MFYDYEFFFLCFSSFSFSIKAEAITSQVTKLTPFAFSLRDPWFACFMRRFPDYILKIATKVLVKLRHRRVWLSSWIKLKQLPGEKWGFKITNLEVFAYVSSCFLNVHHIKCGSHLKNLQARKNYFVSRKLEMLKDFWNSFRGIETYFQNNREIRCFICRNTLYSHLKIHNNVIRMKNNFRQV